METMHVVTPSDTCRIASAVVLQNGGYDHAVQCCAAVVQPSKVLQSVEVAPAVTPYVLEASDFARMDALAAAARPVEQMVRHASAAACNAVAAVTEWARPFAEMNNEYREATKAPTRCLRRRRYRTLFLKRLSQSRNLDDTVTGDAFKQAAQAAWMEVLCVVLMARKALSNVNRRARRAGGQSRAEQLAYDSACRDQLQWQRSASCVGDATARLVSAAILAPRAPQFRLSMA